MEINGRWILDVDIRKYFDTIEHAKVQAMLRQRVNDGVITRLIGLLGSKVLGKWTSLYMLYLADETLCL